MGAHADRRRDNGPEIAHSQTRKSPALHFWRTGESFYAVPTQGDALGHGKEDAPVHGARRRGGLGPCTKWPQKVHGFSVMPYSVLPSSGTTSGTKRPTQCASLRGGVGVLGLSITQKIPRPPAEMADGRGWAAKTCRRSTPAASSSRCYLAHRGIRQRRSHSGVRVR